VIENHSHKPLIWFITVAFGSSWMLYLLPLAFGAPGSQPWEKVRALSWSVAMWGPGLAAFVATRWSGPKRIYLLAWLLPPLLAAVTGIMT
jgi:hypothetical protein